MWIYSKICSIPLACDVYLPSGVPRSSSFFILITHRNSSCPHVNMRDASIYTSPTSPSQTYRQLPWLWVLPSYIPSCFPSSTVPFILGVMAPWVTETPTHEQLLGKIICMPEAELFMNTDKALTRKAVQQNLHIGYLRVWFPGPPPRTFPKALHNHSAGDQVFPRAMPMPEP